jgi:glycosyltransferase involved in cell wall biosynthesis
MSAGVGKILDEERPDILHTHVMTGFSVGTWSQATRRRIRIVHTLRDYYLMCPPGAMYRHTNCERICSRCVPFAAHRRRASRAVRAVTGVSRFILDRHLGAGFFKDSVSAKVIFNPVPGARREGRNPPRDPLVFGFIGRIGPEKGTRWLLESFSGGTPAGSRLLVAGKGAPAFVERLQAEFPSPSISFMGHVDPAVFYEQVDVVVVPSLWNEPFGRTAVEPFSYGIPVIASNRGGLPEIVEDGVTGIIVDPSDAGSLARALRRFSADRELVRRLGGACRERASQFSQETITDAYTSLYADVLCQPGSRPAAPEVARSASAARAR